MTARLGCPHCDAAMISGWHRFHASYALPVRCPSCGGLCLLSLSAQTLRSLVFELLLWSSALLALALRNWLIFLFLPVGVVLGAALFGPLFSFRPVEKGTVVAVRRVAIRQSLVAAFAVGAAWLLLGSE